MYKPPTIITFPEPYVPYTIDVSAATHAGEGDMNTIIDFTEEGSECTILNHFLAHQLTAKIVFLEVIITLTC